MVKKVKMKYSVKTLYVARDMGTDSIGGDVVIGKTPKIIKKLEDDMWDVAEPYVEMSYEDYKKKYGTTLRKGRKTTIKVKTKVRV